MRLSSQFASRLGSLAANWLMYWYVEKQETNAVSKDSFYSDLRSYFQTARAALYQRGAKSREETTGVCFVVGACTVAD